ncbi:MAG TPA: fibronectin-binding domain-containing protein [Firmicutes bacterium]|nr:fibronectin-binding domain-containing protein [Bacillota bacterium]
MAFDGLFLAALATELTDKLVNARIEKVFQPGRKKIVLLLRQPKKNYKLFLSAEPRRAGLFITDKEIINPKVPPSFCMLLRKQIEGGRIESFTQANLDRILSIKISPPGSIGLDDPLELIGEFMGKHSNIILVKKEKADTAILGSIIHVPVEKNRFRSLMPGERYCPPPEQGKNSPGDYTAMHALLTAYSRREENAAVKQGLVNLFQGLSTFSATILSLEAGINPDTRFKDLLPAEIAALAALLAATSEDIEEGRWTFSLLVNAEGKAAGFSCLKGAQNLKNLFTVKTYDSPSALLETFYAHREEEDKLAELSSYLKTLCARELKKVEKKREAIETELAAAARAAEDKIKGEILKAHLHQIKEGAASVTLANYFEAGSDPVLIELDPSLTPSQNVQKYFKRYKKALAAEKQLSKRLEETHAEQEYLKSVLLSIRDAAGYEDLLVIRKELAEEKYVKESGTAKTEKQPKMKPLRYLSADGIPIFVGRNNKQNDYLTLKLAGKNSLWLHAKDIPGSHVIVASSSPPEKTLYEAALLAAYYSRGRDSANVPVDYTAIKNVRKPKGAKAGMVIYSGQKTVYVTPAKEKIEAISLQE